MPTDPDFDPVADLPKPAYSRTAETVKRAFESHAAMVAAPPEQDEPRKSDDFAFRRELDAALRKDGLEPLAHLAVDGSTHPVLECGPACGAPANPPPYEPPAVATNAALERLRSTFRAERSSVQTDIRCALDQTGRFAETCVKAMPEVSRDEVLTAVAVFFAEEIARVR